MSTPRWSIYVHQATNTFEQIAVLTQETHRACYNAEYFIYFYTSLFKRSAIWYHALRSSSWWYIPQDGPEYRSTNKERTTDFRSLLYITLLYITLQKEWRIQRVLNQGIFLTAVIVHWFLITWPPFHTWLCLITVRLNKNNNYCWYYYYNNNYYY